MSQEIGDPAPAGVAVAASTGPIEAGGVAWLLRGRSGAGLVAVLATIGFVAVLCTDKIFNDGDSYWHLAAGEWMLQHGAVPRTDPFSYTFAGRPWRAHEWLAEVLMALAFRAAAWNGLSLLFAGAFGATVATLAAYLRRWLSPGPLVVVVGFAMAVGAPSLLARPHLLALPILALWLASLLRARERQAGPPWTLLAVMCVWANLHGSFVVGLALIAPFALEAVVADRAQPWRTGLRWGLFGILSLGASLLTPHGVSGLTFPLAVSGMDSLPVITEWHSPDFTHLGMLEIAILEALFICLWRGVKVPAIRLLLLLGFLHLALQHMRHQAVFAVAAAMLLAEPFARSALDQSPDASHRGASPVRLLQACGLGFVVLVAGLARLSAPITPSDGLNVPVSALAALPRALQQQPMFNEYGFGGYMIFKGLRPYIDGRGDMYGDAFMNNYAAMTHPDLVALNRELDARHVTWTILAPHNPAVAVLDAQPRWRRIYADRVAVIHVLQDPGFTAGAQARPGPAALPSPGV